MLWDRSDDSVGCVPYLIVRAIDSGTYDHEGLTNQINCAKDNRFFSLLDDNESCRYDEAELSDYQASTTTC